MFDHILAYFEKESWLYSLPEEGDSIAIFGISTKNAKYKCILKVEEDANRLIFFSILPLHIHSSQRSELAEILTRINYNLFYGSFEMDFTDGEIRYKTSFIYEDSIITEKVLDHIIKGNITTADMNFELLSAFSNKQINMDDAIKEIQSKDIGHNDMTTID